MKLNNKNSFCDWITVTQIHKTQQKPINNGFSLKIDTNGKEVFTSPIPKNVEGLHGSNFQISSTFDENTGFYRNKFSGNISRYNRSEATEGLTIDEFKNQINHAMRELGLSEFTIGETKYRQTQQGKNLQKIYDGAILSRLDLAANFQTGSANNRDLVLQHIQTLQYPRLQKTLIGLNTYAGKESESRLIRVYDKALEMEVKHLKNTDEPKYIQSLIDHFNEIGLIRIETEYHRFMRTSDLRYWHNATHKNFLQYFQKDVNFMAKPIQKLDINTLPTMALSMLLMYQAGIKLIDKYDRKTIAKYRKILLEYGYDISNKNISMLKPKQKTIILSVAEMPDFYKYPETINKLTTVK